MAQINIVDLTFSYENSYDNIFENVSFSIDTDWKIGLIGRNGKGKTTFLRLLMGEYECRGSISSSSQFDYVPYLVKKEWEQDMTIEVVERVQPNYEMWRVCKELSMLKTEADILYRTWNTLSHGERTKVMLALLFATDERQKKVFLIDEPTNHLDMPTRIILKDYLNNKKGYILVSHDRWLLDECVDHILALNQNSIQVEKGNFSSWWENKRRREKFEQTENEKLRSEIRKMEEASRRTAVWADKVENRKIGFDPVKEPDRATRAYFGAKSKALQKQKRNIQNRQQKAVEEKSHLLNDMEREIELKCTPIFHHKECYIYAKNLKIVYPNNFEAVENISFTLSRGGRIAFQGKNGSGKSTIIKSILQAKGVEVLGGTHDNTKFGGEIQQGELTAASGLKISYINQDTSFLTGTLDCYIDNLGIDEPLFKSMLRKLGFERTQFEKRIENYSEGQKKKVLIAGSLLQEAHLYIWDEPLNYIDVFSRMQLEQLILKYQPTMLLVEHDQKFIEQVATETLAL